MFVLLTLWVWSGFYGFETIKQKIMSTEKDLNYWKANAEEDYMQVPISVLAYITELETVVKNCSIPVVSKRLRIGSKVCMIAHKNITGKVVDRSDVGFNHWMVKWHRTGEIVREYGADLVVC